MTKALALCRAFHDAGHRVVLVESAKYRWTGHRFSRAVDAFHTIPDPGSDRYAAALLDIAEREGVDIYVPVCSPGSSVPDARAKELLLGTCEVLHPDLDDVVMLDDKFAFNQTATSLGLTVPETHRVTDPEQVLAFDYGSRSRFYVLKSIRYDPVHRLDLTRLPFGAPEDMRAFVTSLPISQTNPWILQEFVEGREFCTHGTVRDGHLRVYCCCESSAFQLNYAMVDKPRIRDWVEGFVGPLGLTGQVSFDFIEAADGTPYAIECNPRTHSAITLFYDHPGLASAYLAAQPKLTPGATAGTGSTSDGSDPLPVVVPTATARPTYWLYNEVWKLITRTARLDTARTILQGKDAIFDPHDPLPFLLVHHLQIPSLLLASLRRRATWLRIDFNIGKLVEPAGD
jgi:hypothetical protein